MLQSLAELAEKSGGGEPSLIGADQQRQILCHEAGLDRADHDLLQCLGKTGKLGVVVELGAMLEAARPGENRSGGVGRCLPTLLMLAVVAGGSGRRARRRIRILFVSRYL